MHVLLYATEACPLSACDIQLLQLQLLEFTITRIVMKIFHTGSAEMVKIVILTCLFDHRSILTWRGFYKS